MLLPSTGKLKHRNSESVFMIYFMIHTHLYKKDWNIKITFNITKRNLTIFQKQVLGLV